MIIALCNSCSCNPTIENLIVGFILFGFIIAALAYLWFEWDKMDVDK